MALRSQSTYCANFRAAWIALLRPPDFDAEALVCGSALRASRLLWGTSPLDMTECGRFRLSLVGEWSLLLTTNPDGVRLTAFAELLLRR
jgi:hypothetical protein